MYENFDGAHLLARTVAMAVSGWPLLTRKWILTQYMMKSNISDSFFLKKFHIKTKTYNMILFQIGGWRRRFLFASPLFPGFPWRWMAPPFCCQCVEFVERSLSEIILRDFQLHCLSQNITISFCFDCLTFVLPSLKFWLHHQSMNMTVRHWSSLAVCFAKYSNFVLTD